jgi:hypothetical protein
MLNTVLVLQFWPWVLVPGLLTKYPAKTSKRMKATFLVAGICQTRR